MNSSHAGKGKGSTCGTIMREKRWNRKNYYFANIPGIETQVVKSFLHSQKEDTMKGRIKERVA